MNKKVIVYSAPWCPWCHKAMDFLKANKIEFQEKDVEKDSKYVEELQKWSGQTGIPVIVIEDKDVIVGFDQAKLKMLLNIK